MEASDHTYIAIDLKSFYASVECVERHLDPLTTNLLVADAARTDKTICLAVTPSLKAIGVPSRPRLFEAKEKIGVANVRRREACPRGFGVRSSTDAKELAADPRLRIDTIIATPRMGLYLKYSNEIYGIYLKYIAPEDIHVYSVDEVFMDVTGYLKTYHMSAQELAMTMIRDVLRTTGITATAGIGTNLYLAKVAMDIVAKKMPPDRDGVRIAALDERTYRRTLWTHEPLTDFWRVGHGIAASLAKVGIRNMGQIALCSVGDEKSFYNENLLYRLFGVNAELLIDHAWGAESCTMPDIKNYRSKTNSVSNGQVLPCAYPHEKGALAVREMADCLAMDLTARGLYTRQIDVCICYDISSVARAASRVERDMYGREVPAHAVGTVRLPEYTDSARLIAEAAVGVYERITDPALDVRRIFLTASSVLPPDRAKLQTEQISFFDDPEEEERKTRLHAFLDKEKRKQQAVYSLWQKYGKNAVIKGMDLQEDATTVLRNGQIGGHRA